MEGHKKVGVVMGEFKRGTLRSGSGQKVTNRDQAVAIAMSEAGMARSKRKRKGTKSNFRKMLDSGMPH